MYLTEDTAVEQARQTNNQERSTRRGKIVYFGALASGIIRNISDD